MQKWTSALSTQNINNWNHNQLFNNFFTENSIFFDIETTGFSPANTQIYLIGCATRKGSEITIKQFFADNISDEKSILIAFFQLLENYQTIITFNGNGFDIPYIKAKCKQYQLPDFFFNKETKDLLKIATNLKFLLNLPNYKQKTIEDFLGLHRNDMFDGGELIPIYQEYIAHPNEQQLFFLKQHNYEDIIGMTELLPILNYYNFIEGGYTISSIESNLFTDYNGNPQKELIFSLNLDVPLPKRVSYRYEAYYLTACDSEAKLQVQLLEDELKFFFNNYKDYYYLPSEDISIHKDVASYVAKEHRKKATAATCYTKKLSLFLPQYQTIVEPAFHKQYKAKISYFELCDNFVESEILQKKYIQHIISHIFALKK